MSLLPSQSWVSANNPLFLLANISSLTSDEINAKKINTIGLSTGSATISSITGLEGGVNIDFAFVSSLNSDGRIEATEFSSIFTYANEGTVSTLYTQHIVLDTATLDVIGGNILLLNGVPIATTSTSISSLTDWSFFPAIYDVDMNTFNLSNCGNINSQNIFNALNVQSDTFSALTSVTAPSAVITNARTTGFSTNTLQVNTVNNGANTNWISPLSVSSLTVSTLTTPVLTAPVVRASGVSSLTISTGTINGTPFISGSNWSQYPANSAVTLAGNNINTSGSLTVGVTSNTTINSQNVSIVADKGISIASITEISLQAQNGNRGRIELTAEPGFNNGVAGEIVLTANGGQLLGVGTGGTISLTANTPIGFSNLTSKIDLNASGVNSYAGSLSPIASVYGYNFVYGQNGVSLCAGVPPSGFQVPGTVFLSGTTGVTTSSDFYCVNLYPYWNGLTTPPDLTINGRYIIPNLAQVCVRMSNVRQIDFQSNVTTYMSNLDTLSMSSNGSITTSNLGTTVLSATNGSITTLSNTTLTGAGSGSITGYTNLTGAGTGSITGFPTISTINFRTSTINDFALFGTRSLRIGGDVAQIQISNNNPFAGGTNLNLLGRTGYTEIQSFNSSFTVKRPLALKALYISTADTFYLASTFTATNEAYIAQQRQPFIQRGTVLTSGGTGSQQVELSTFYANTSYQSVASMNDTNPAQVAVNNDSVSSITVSWGNAGGGNHQISFITFGDLTV